MGNGIKKFIPFFKWGGITLNRIIAEKKEKETARSVRPCHTKK